MLLNTLPVLITSKSHQWSIYDKLVSLCVFWIQILPNTNISRHKDLQNLLQIFKYCWHSFCDSREMDENFPPKTMYTLSNSQWWEIPHGICKCAISQLIYMQRILRSSVSYATYYFVYALKLCLYSLCKEITIAIQKIGILPNHYFTAHVLLFQIFLELIIAYSY